MHSGLCWLIVAVLQTTFSNAFSFMKMIEFRFEFHWNLFPIVQLSICQHWFMKWLGAEQATSHYPNQCRLNSLTHIRDIGGDVLSVMDSTTQTLCRQRQRQKRVRDLIPCCGCRMIIASSSIHKKRKNLWLFAKYISAYVISQKLKWLEKQSYVHIRFFLELLVEFAWTHLTLIPAWIGDYILSKVWDEITYPFLNFNGCTVEV